MNRLAVASGMLPVRFAASLWLVAALAGCGGSGVSPSDKLADANRPIRVVCTTGMVADLVRHVGGEQVEVDQLMGPGVDPHVYKPSTGDISRLERADCVIYSGLHLEGKLADIFAQMARHKPTLAVAEQIEKSRLLETAPGQYDPHVWFDVSLWRQALPAVRDALTARAPQHAAKFAERCTAYELELEQLHDECLVKLASIPASLRVLVTAHDAFHYFGRAYSVEVRAVQGVSTESEAGVRDINQLVEFLVERKIKALFVESSVSARNIQALVEGCQSRGHSIVIVGELFSDAMGAANSSEGTYPGMVRHNLYTIVAALR